MPNFSTKFIFYSSKLLALRSRYKNYSISNTWIVKILQLLYMEHYEWKYFQDILKL